MHSSALFSIVLFFAFSIFPTTLSKAIKAIEPQPVDIVYQFPVGTWVEDLAFQTNGKMLTTSLTSPDLLEFDMKFNPPRVVHTFGNKTSCTGMFSFVATVMNKDVFYVIAGNMDLKPFTFSPVRGSWSVYRVALHRHRHNKPADVSLVADFPDSIMLNRIAGLNRDKKWYLVGDSGAGIVYRLHAKSGKVAKVLDDPLMKPKKPDSASFGVGINDMSVTGDYLYFTNTDQNIFARIAIDEHGNSKGFAAEVITHLDRPTGFVYDFGDDMDFAQHRDNRLARVSGDIVTRLAPNVTGEEGKLFGPTSLGWGHKDTAGILFISTNGGTAQYLTGEYTRGGTISQVSLHEQ